MNESQLHVLRSENEVLKERMEAMLQELKSFKIKPARVNTAAQTEQDMYLQELSKFTEEVENEKNQQKT